MHVSALINPIVTDPFSLVASSSHPRYIFEKKIWMYWLKENIQ